MRAARTNRVTTAERENDRVERKGDRKKMPRPRICLFEIDNFRARSVGEIAGELEIDREASDGQKYANHPVNESKTNGAGPLQDSARCVST
jgi:hypothetical protein